MSSSWSSSRQGVGGGPGQPHRNDLQLQERLVGVHERCGQTAGGRKCLNGLLLLGSLRCSAFHRESPPLADALLRCEQLCWLENLHTRGELGARLLLSQRDRVVRDERHDGRQQSLPEGKVGDSRQVSSRQTRKNLVRNSVCEKQNRPKQKDPESAELSSRLLLLVMVPSTRQWISSEDATSATLTGNKKAKSESSVALPWREEVVSRLAWSI